MFAQNKRMAGKEVNTERRSVEDQRCTQRLNLEKNNGMNN